jgi:NADP-dependent 3-hydroxy acid dehydrogenase YdfG
LVPAYRKLGYAVVGTSRTITPSSGDPMIATVQGDIAQADAAARVIGHAIERFGRVDTLINNAGVSPGSSCTSTAVKAPATDQ